MTERGRLPVLAFDVSGPACAAALLTDADGWSRVEPMARGQADRLIPLLEALLSEHAVRWSSIALIATVRGPGSFTGVRVGVAAARALALALNRPVAAIDLFDALAAQYAAAGRRAPVAVCAGAGSAKRWRAFSFDGDAPARDAEGEGAPGDAWPAVIGPAAADTDPARAIPGFEAVDPLALARLAAARGPDPVGRAPTPFYSRAPDALVSATPPPRRIEP